MEADPLLLLVGIVGMLYGLLMIAIYVFREKGTLLDPIVISWAGYIIFVPFAMFAVGMGGVYRKAAEPGATAVIFVILATAAYTLGLYAGSGRSIKKIVPLPTPTLSLMHVWFIWAVGLVCGLGGYGVLMTMGPSDAASIVIAFISGGVGSVVLVALIVVFTYRGALLMKVLMLASIAGMFAFTFWTSFSRRPIMALAIACLAVFYHVKLRFYNRMTQGVFILSLGVLLFTINLYLEAVRGTILYGDRVQAGETFSQENVSSVLGGITINFIVFEYLLEVVPESHPHLLGSGFVPGLLFFIPRVIWPTKPVGSGYVATQIFLADNEPDYTIATTIIGELFLNFGLIGVIVGMFLIGKLIRMGNRLLRDNQHNMVLWMAWFIVIPDLIGEWRGDFTSMTVQGVLRVAIFLGLAWMAGKAFPLARSPAPLPTQVRYAAAILAARARASPGRQPLPGAPPQR